MLLLMAIVAFAVYLVRDHYLVHVRVQNANVRFVSCYKEWLEHRATVNEIVKTSEKIAREEAESIWTSIRGAQDEHIERMKMLESDIRGCWGVTSSRQSDELRAVHENIRKYSLQ